MSSPAKRTLPLGFEDRLTIRDCERPFQSVNSAAWNELELTRCALNNESVDCRHAAYHPAPGGREVGPIARIGERALVARETPRNYGSRHTWIRTS
jgi:hypothetical protein